MMFTKRFPQKRSTPRTRMTRTRRALAASGPSSTTGAAALGANGLLGSLECSSGGPWIACCAVCRAQRGRCSPCPDTCLGVGLDFSFRRSWFACGCPRAVTSCPNACLSICLDCRVDAPRSQSSAWRLLNRSHPRGVRETETRQFQAV